MNDKNSGNILEEALSLFGISNVQNQKQDVFEQFKKQNISYSSDLTEKMIAELACMSTELIPHLPQAAMPVDKYIKLTQEYSYNLPKAKEYDYTVGRSRSLDSLKECVNILKNHIKIITQTIENTFIEHYGFLYENDCDEEDEKIAAMRDIKLSEKEMLISQYRLLIYGYIVFLETEIDDIKKKTSKNPFDF